MTDIVERLRKDVENANFAMCHANDVASTVRAVTIEECEKAAIDCCPLIPNEDERKMLDRFLAAIRALKEQK